ncbi:MAG: HAMP domain-containing sensor histidine kinase [Coriobacteriia bacterium]|nr:HAMP domain-containing sensor histidine kinase [Coriobacteriia bacterium]
MRKLQTYIAVVTLLLVLMMLSILGAYAIIAEGANPSILFMLIPLALVTLGIALYLGSLIAQPLEDLNARIRVRRAKNIQMVTTHLRDLSSSAEDGGSANRRWPWSKWLAKQMRFSEAHTLAEEADALMQLDEAQKAYLDLLEKRQLEFVGDVAHELRTPLTAIRGDAEVLMDPDLPPELHQKFCENIVRESERLTRLTVDLTTLLKAREDNPEERRDRADLREIAEMAVGSLSPILRENDAHVTIEGEAPEILCDHDKMEEVVSNLVDNANRFIEAGGHITIVLSGEDGQSVLSVLDDGPGFGDIDPRLLFERFYRTDFSRSRNRGGSGLGLAIVKGIVEAHGGTVEAANRPEGGARFTVRMPAA